MPSEPTPTLLKLPPELRITIFEYALIADDTLPVTSETQLPALFATNRQIRQETMPIWFTKYDFDFSINNCDASVAIKFYQGTALKHYDTLGKQSYSMWSGRPSWKNVLYWSRAVFEGNMPGLRTMPLEEELDQAEPMASIVAAAHEVCLESRVKSWKQCEQILSSLRRVAVFQDRQWLDD